MHPSLMLLLFVFLCLLLVLVVVLACSPCSEGVRKVFGRCSEGPGRLWKVLEGSGRLPHARVASDSDGDASRTCRVGVRRRGITHLSRRSQTERDHAPVASESDGDGSRIISPASRCNRRWIGR